MSTRSAGMTNCSSNTRSTPFCPTRPSRSLGAFLVHRRLIGVLGCVLNSTVSDTNQKTTVFAASEWLFEGGTPGWGNHSPN